MPLRLKVAQKGMILVLVPVIFELVFVATLAMLVANEANQYRQMQRSKIALLEMEHFYSTAMRTIELLNSGDSIPHAQKTAKLVELQKSLQTNKYSWGTLKPWTNPEVMELKKGSDESKRMVLEILNKTISAYKLPSKDLRPIEADAKHDYFLSFILDSEQLNKRFLAIEDRIVKEEPEEQKRFRENLLTILFFGILVNIVVSILLIAFFTRQVVSRLQSIAGKAQLIAAGKQLPTPDQRTDEIGEIDQLITNAGSTLADARMRESAIFDGTAHVICSLDSKLKIQTVSNACIKQWHYPTDEVLGRTLLSLLSADDVEQTRKAFDEITRGSSEGKVETVMRCGDGVNRHMLWNVNWRNRSYYCVVQDVTELRSVEQLRQHFFSMASHDLRSPLTAIGMNVQMVADGAKGEVSDKVRTELNKVENNLSQLMSLVNEILALEKLEAARATLTPSAVNAADICEAAKESLADLTSELGITISSPRGSALLDGDEEKIEQAVTHLLKGAVKFSNSGSQITTSISKAEGRATISFSQDGFKIPPEEVALLFEKFRQTHNQLQPVQRAGLGFAIARAIAELHGGAVGVINPDDGGSKIWISFPLHSEDGNEQEEGYG